MHNLGIKVYFNKSCFTTLKYYQKNLLQNIGGFVIHEVSLVHLKLIRVL